MTSDRIERVGQRLDDVRRDEAALRAELGRGRVGRRRRGSGDACIHPLREEGGGDAREHVTRARGREAGHVVRADQHALAGRADEGVRAP